MLIIVSIIIFKGIFAEEKELDHIKADILDINKSEEAFKKLGPLLSKSDEDARDKLLEILNTALKSNDISISKKAYSYLAAYCYVRKGYFNEEQPDIRFKKDILEKILKKQTSVGFHILIELMKLYKLSKEEVEQLIAASEQYKPKNNNSSGLVEGGYESLIRGIAQGGGMNAYEPFIRHFNIDFESTYSLHKYEEYFLLMNDEGAINRFMDKLKTPERYIHKSSHFLIVNSIISKRIKQNSNQENIDFCINYIKLLNQIIEDKDSQNYLINSALQSVSYLGNVNKEFKALAKPIILNNFDKWSNSHIKNQIENNLEKMDKIDQIHIDQNSTLKGIR